MEKVTIVLEKSETGYGVYSDDIPGVYSYGDTVQKALRNMAGSIDLSIKYYKGGR